MLAGLDLWKGTLFKDFHPYGVHIFSFFVCESSVSFKGHNYVVVFPFPYLHVVGQPVILSAFKDNLSSYEQQVFLGSTRSSIHQEARWHPVEGESLSWDLFGSLLL